jgi:hypothetical protein
MTNKQKVRLASISLLAGCIVSALIFAVAQTGIAFWFPTFWPGLFFSWFIVAVFEGGDWPSKYGLVVMAISNAVFYAWLSYLAIRADLQATGRIGKYLLQ